MTDTTPGKGDGCGCELLDEGRHCGDTPIGVFVTGCVNEHLGEEPLCARHADMSKRHELWCSDCWALAGVYVRAVTLAKILPSGERQRVPQI
ncbi:hypothetical protein ACQEVF_59105 [Nonomuraea polychroma]|uniref:hypothetical protein n=1 Tax=Nonomuraea polychroma TaxID=46176 RepID=UPI003D94F7E0